MSELHLDLCRQSTDHLKETVEAIKENLRLLEVFIKAGLTDEEKSSTASNTALTGTGETALQRLNGEGESTKDSKTSRDKKSKKGHHECCCCMCPIRLERNKQNCSNYYGNSSSANSILRRIPFPSYKRPVSMPRLNRTASLRRDTAIERCQRENKSIVLK